MTVVVRQTMVDDSGVFTDGTAVNKAFVDQLYDQVDDQAHSTANPTVKPKTITDEVVTARGAEANLAAKLATLVSTTYLLGTDLGTTWKISGGRSIQFSDADVAHGMTTIAPTDVWGSIDELSGTAGGIIFTGLSDLDQRGLQLYGINGGAAPTTGGITVVGAKKSGTGAVAFAAAELVIGFYNYLTLMGKFYGDGSLELTTGGLSVGFAGQAGADEVQVGDANFKLDWVSATLVRMQFDTNDYIEYDRSLDSMGLNAGAEVIISCAKTRLSGYLELGEGAAPAAPSANNGRLYLEDNGAGKTKLMILFSSGAAQQIAIQP